MPFAPQKLTTRASSCKMNSTKGANIRSTLGHDSRRAGSEYGIGQIQMAAKLESDNGRLSAGLADLFYPAAQHFQGSRFQIDKFNAHADPRLNDSNHAQRFHLLILARHGKPNAGV